MNRVCHNCYTRLRTLHQPLKEAEATLHAFFVVFLLILPHLVLFCLPTLRKVHLQHSDARQLAPAGHSTATFCDHWPL